MNRVLVDVTQFSRQPARSGVQRALAELAAAWPSMVTADFFIRRGRNIHLLKPEVFADVVHGYFGRPPQPDDAGWLVTELDARGVSAPEKVLGDAAILLPEPTYDPEVVVDLRIRSESGQLVGAVAYDAFPMTHPWAFPGNGRTANSPYFRLLATVPLAFATSDAVASTLVDRLRRRSGSTPVTWLGTDHVSASPSSLPDRSNSAFVMVGTVEPRKRIPLAVSALRRLVGDVPEASLTIVGRPGCEEPHFLAELQRRASDGGSVRWLTDAPDAEVSELLSKATALLSLGDEGFGLPVVEALRHGCPVLYGGQQPVASLVQGRGAWAVEDLTVAGIARTLRPWCEPNFAARRRDQIVLDGLPTWQHFATRIAETLAVAS